jgi:hypothetical protein
MALLPVENPTSAYGLAVPDSLPARADEVIE